MAGKSYQEPAGFVKSLDTEVTPQPPKPVSVSSDSRRWPFEHAETKRHPSDVWYETFNGGLSRLLPVRDCGPPVAAGDTFPYESVAYMKQIRPTVAWHCGHSIDIVCEDAFCFISHPAAMQVLVAAIVVAGKGSRSRETTEHNIQIHG